jgi:hypothetical protein
MVEKSKTEEAFRTSIMESIHTCTNQIEEMAKQIMRLEDDNMKLNRQLLEFVSADKKRQLEDIQRGLGEMAPIVLPPLQRQSPMTHASSSSRPTISDANDYHDEEASDDHNNDDEEEDQPQPLPVPRVSPTQRQVAGRSFGHQTSPVIATPLTTNTNTNTNTTASSLASPDRPLTRHQLAFSPISERSEEERESLHGSYHQHISTSRHPTSTKDQHSSPETDNSIEHNLSGASQTSIANAATAKGGRNAPVPWNRRSGSTNGSTGTNGHSNGSDYNGDDSFDQMLSAPINVNSTSTSSAGSLVGVGRHGHTNNNSNVNTAMGLLASPMGWAPKGSPLSPVPASPNPLYVQPFSPSPLRPHHNNNNTNNKENQNHNLHNISGSSHDEHSLASPSPSSSPSTHTTANGSNMARQNNRHSSLPSQQQSQQQLQAWTVSPATSVTSSPVNIEYGTVRDRRLSSQQSSPLSAADEEHSSSPLPVVTSAAGGRRNINRQQQHLSSPSSSSSTNSSPVPVHHTGARPRTSVGNRLSSHATTESHSIDMVKSPSLKHTLSLRQFVNHH